MFVAKNYTNRVYHENTPEINEMFKNKIIEVVKEIFKDKPMFNMSNFNFYFFDEHMLKTSTFKNPYSILYVEINQPKNFKPIISETLKKAKVKDDNKIKAPQLHLTLKEIKETLYDTSISFFDENTLIWIDKYSINFAYNFQKDETEKETYYFKVIPCLTYKNKDNVNGVIYYNDTENLIEIEYPKLSILNFNIKTQQTNGLFADYVVMFKNFFMKEKKEKELPFQIFEILLYNVPNEIYIDLSLNNIYKVINYLRNFNIKDFITLDNQDYAFTSPYKSLSILYAGHCIKKISNYIKTIQ